jgi:hypothetical protein
MAHDFKETSFNVARINDVKERVKRTGMDNASAVDIILLTATMTVEDLVRDCAIVAATDKKAGKEVPGIIQVMTILVGAVSAEVGRALAITNMPEEAMPEVLNTFFETMRENLELNYQHISDQQRMGQESKK